jgi:hypothetical protein
MVSRMHHHRLVLNGAPAAVARLADELRAAGAVAIAGGDAPPMRLVWATPRASAVEALCARHRAVVVGLERFETLGEELERLVLHGREATVLERRTLAADPDDDGYGVSLDEQAAPLDPSGLRAAARRVSALPAIVGPGLLATSLDDALLIGPALGRLCAAAGDPLADEPPPAAALDEVAGLAAIGLTIGAASAGSMCPAELAFERAWRLAVATAVAGREELWARPGDADWAEWLMDLLAGAAAVIESSAACLHQPAPPFVSLHTEHFSTVEEQLDHAAGDLVTTALQTLALFDRRTLTQNG